jgi:alpha-beta hydrolase superfamily lysophospholipase
MTQHETGNFTGQGGVEIFHQSWLPDAEPRGEVVLVHGVSEHSGRYRHVVERLLGDGFAVRALDHRGHGRSAGPRAVIDSVPAALADIDTLLENAAPHPFMLGHSMGGCLAIGYALAHPDRLAGLVLSAPLAEVPDVPAPVRAGLRLLARALPALGVWPLDVSGISSDPQEVAAYVADPLNHHGRLPVRTVVALADAVAANDARLGELTLPMLVMHGEDDPIVPIAASRLVAARVGSADVTLHVHPGLLHEIFNEAPAGRERVLDDLAAWLAVRALS